VTGHVPVMAEAAVAALGVVPDGVYVDGTFGRGGHSRRLLAALGGQGRLLALDRDPQAIDSAREIADPRFEAVHSEFSALGEVLAARGIEGVNGVLLDLGVSSPQLDEPARGFSFRADAPLDMRMNTRSGLRAAEWLATADESEISGVIKEYGEERFARQIARALVAARQIEPVTTTGRLAEIVAGAVRTREPGQHPATRTFQAIRIYINRELEELSAVLPQCVRHLRPGGRLAVISFHSLEDRIVKRFLREAAAGQQMPRKLPVRADQLAEGELRLIGRAIRADAAEIHANPRARSAVLRVAERRA
jgi:16S rRNA (cytosine1402-N4)-methyltransferase